MQARGEQLAEEQSELVAVRHELNQRDRELSRRATEQATEAANTQVCHLCHMQRSSGGQERSTVFSAHDNMTPVTMSCSNWMQDICSIGHMGCNSISVIERT